MQVHVIPCLSDNYGFVFCPPSHEKEGAEVEKTACLVIDPPPDPILVQWLSKKHLHVVAILNTHHHLDHVGGNAALVECFQPEVVGSKRDAKQGLIPYITKPVSAGDVLDIAGVQLEVWELPGHTQGHIGYFAKKEKIFFVGDTLFSVGCGRLLGGTAPQLFSSLKQLCQLPDDTKMYAAHEYTLQNIQFAMSLPTKNEELQAYYKHVLQLRKSNKFTIPFEMGLQKRINPFLLTPKDFDPLTYFTKIRNQKDNWS